MGVRLFGQEAGEEGGVCRAGQEAMAGVGHKLCLLWWLFGWFLGLGWDGWFSRAA